MQMQRVETKAGTAICIAPSRMARIIGFLIARLRWMFSISTVASSTRMPTASARPPNVMMFIVWPSAPRTMIEQKIDKGIEVATTSVERQFPRKRRIISAVRQADDVDGGGARAFQNGKKRGANPVLRDN